MKSIKTLLIALLLTVATGWLVVAQESPLNRADYVNKKAVKPELKQVMPESTFTYLFTSKPGAKEVVENEELGLSICAHGKNTGGEYSGIVFVPGDKQPKFKVYSSTGIGKPDKLVVDWNCNDDYSDETIMSAPGQKASAHTVMINGTNREITIVQREANHDFIIFRPSKWYYGKLMLNGKAYKAAIIDVDMDGINFSGNDKLALDLDGDGIFCFSGKSLEGQVALRSKMMLLNKIYNVTFDPVSSKVTMSKCIEAGTVEIITFPDWVDPVITIRVFDKKGNHILSNLVLKGSVFELPSDHYSSVALEVTFNKGKDEYHIFMSSNAFTVKANETTSLTMQVPSGLDPKVRIVRGVVKVQKGFVVDKLLGGIELKGEFLYNNKQVPAPKISIFNGTLNIAEGVMEYG